MYTQEYMKHFSNPQNIGVMEDADATEDVSYQGGGCFDRVRIFVKLRGDIIEKITYQTRGCSGTIAACSAMSKMAPGMTLKQAAGIEGNVIAESLGGVPERKQHSMDLAAEALRTVISKLSAES